MEMFPNPAQQQQYSGGGGSMDGNALLRSLQQDLHGENDLQLLLDSCTGLHPHSTQQQQQTQRGMLPPSLLTHYQMAQQQSPHWAPTMDSGDHRPRSQYPPHHYKHSSRDSMSQYPSALFQQLSEGVLDNLGSLGGGPLGGGHSSLLYHEGGGLPASMHMVDSGTVVPTQHQLSHAEEDFHMEISPPANKQKKVGKGSMTIKEKNRKAQKRFRERQKQKLIQLEAREKNLSEELMVSKNEVEKLKKERDMMIKKLNLHEGQISLLQAPNLSHMEITLEDDQFSNSNNNSNNDNHNPNHNFKKCDNFYKVQELAQTWKKYIQDLQSLIYIDRQITNAENEDSSNNNNNNEQDDDDEFQGESIGFKEDVSSLTQSAINQCLDLAMTYPTSAKYLICCDVEKEISQIQYQNKIKKECQQHQQQQQSDNNSCDKDEDEEEMGTQDDQDQEEQDQDDLEDKMKEEDENMNNDEDEDITKIKIESSEIVEFNSIKVWQQFRESGDWGLVLGDLQLKSQQVESLLRLREKFLDEWSMLSDERSSIKDMISDNNENAKSNKEISQMGLKVTDFLKKIQVNISEEHQIHMEFLKSVFKDVLNAAQIAKISIYSYPFFPDVLDLASQLCQQYDTDKHS